VCHSNPHQCMPSTTVTASHVTQGRVEYESTIPRGMDGGLDLWEVCHILPVSPPKSRVRERLKGKVHPTTGHEGPEGELRYSSTLSLTSVVDVSGRSAPCPGYFAPRKETWYPLCRKLGGPNGWSGQVWKISPPPGFDPQTIQPLSSRYTNYSIPAHT
jgi:hypothetical protein